MKVFVTGHKGYIGSHLVELLKEAGHTVTGCDIGLFVGCEWEPLVPADKELVKDVRALTVEDIEGHDCVMHLAAISNDPMGDVNQDLTLSINRDASILIASLCKQAGVERYLFSGSCSVYGKGEKLDLTEEDSLHPLTAYARSKIDTEIEVSKLADENFTPVYLRNATAYGFSRCLRIDLVVNNLLASALAFGEARIMSDGSPWRPLIHCRDIARAFIAVMNAPREAVHDRAINIGGNEENYQVRDVAEAVGKVVVDARIAYTGEIGNDPRDYRVKFDLLNELIPDFKLEHCVASGVEELHRKMVDFGFSFKDFEGDQFVRLRSLGHRMHLIQS